MLVFATSDKGGTGRSVTSSNVVYRRALQGGDVCYLDFDFGSPTAGAIFTINAVVNGVPERGLHSYLLGKATEPARYDIWSASDSPLSQSNVSSLCRRVPSLCRSYRGIGSVPTRGRILRIKRDTETTRLAKGRYQDV